MTEPQRPWIHGPALDLSCFTLGWLVALAAFVVVDVAEIENGRAAVLLAIGAVTFLHRHVTFPLVYGDPEEMATRRAAYVLVPIGVVALMTASVVLARPAVIDLAPPPDASFEREATFTLCIHRGDAMRAVIARFSGDERTPAALTALLERPLEGAVTLERHADRIRLSSPDADLLQVYGTRGTLASLGGSYPVINSPPTRPLLAVLVALALAWNVYHTVAQKIGLLRFYDRKAGATSSGGGATLDRAFAFSWLAFAALWLGSSPGVREVALRSAPEAAYVAAPFERAADVATVLAWVALAVALLVTARFFARERALGRSGFSPRGLFALSIVALFAVLLVDALVGYAVFAFSHAIEYLGFANVFARRKYLARPAGSSLMARAVRWQALSFGAFALVVVALFASPYAFGGQDLIAYAVGTSIVHFLYDGWIWKARSPRVGSPLGLEYAGEPTHASPAR